MNGPTPDQLRSIEQLASEFDKFWYLDGNSKEVRLKSFTLMRKVQNLLWKKRFTVFAMYHWAKRKWVLTEFNCYHFPIDHDNMPIAGFPMKYELKGGWSIPKRELTFLSCGPLAAEGLHVILVPADIGWRRFVNWFKQLAPIAGGSIAILGPGVRYWPELVLLVSNVF
jgi:hypothetical protein